MYAAIHTRKPVAAGTLLNLALEFSPVVEETDGNMVAFPIAPLRKLIGSPHQIASEICRVGHERRLEANLALALNVDTAILLARHVPGVTLVPSRQEAARIASIPIAALFSHDVPVDAKLLDILHRWGLKTCGDLARLPETGVAERLGAAGVYLRNLACGAIDRPLRVPASPTSYEQRVELEHPLHLLEPLLFLFGSVVSDLCRRLRSQSMAARSLEIHLELESHAPYHCELEFPVPLDQTSALLKLLQLHLERHPPEAPIVAFTLRINPAAPKRIQHGFFLPPMPAADKLQITLARIAAMVGSENVGTPVLLNTHRPDAFEMAACNPAPPESSDGKSDPAAELHLALRFFRPALHARVRVVAFAPKHIVATTVRGEIVRCAGPWKTSGEWWAASSWVHEEWDVALENGALYRVYQEMKSREWYVQGVYD